MSLPLLRASFKKHWLLILIFTLILMLYSSFASSTYNVQDAHAMEEMLKMLPEDLISAFGWSDLGNTYTEYVSAFLYGFIMVVFPIILFVLLANALVAKEVDNGSIAYLLATPNSRVTIILTKAVFLFLATSFAYWVATFYTIVLSQALYPNLLDLSQFFAISVIVYLVLSTLTAICFFCSCLFNDYKLATGFVAGVPIFMILTSMLGEAVEELGVLRYFTLFTLVDTDKAFYQSGYALSVSLILALSTLAFYTASIIVFNKKSLAV